MNNKGFMMAEVVVVSSIILIALTAFYVSYNKIISIYNQRLDYYDVSTLYKLAEYRDNSLPDNPRNGLNKDTGGEKIYYVNKNTIKNNNLNASDINQTFKDYLSYLSTSLDFDSLPNKLLVMEKCDSDDGESNCKYAYLEVYK